jgi:hypothetical protein
MPISKTCWNPKRLQDRRLKHSYNLHFRPTIGLIEFWTPQLLRA